MLAVLIFQIRATHKAAIRFSFKL